MLRPHENAEFRMSVDGTVKYLRSTSSPATSYQLVGTEVDPGTSVVKSPWALM